MWNCDVAVPIVEEILEHLAAFAPLLNAAPKILGVRSISVTIS
jgi:hypothetical protein